MADENPLDPDVSDLQTAKIALHGALSMLRNVQDINQRLKGELQEALNREKMALQRSQGSDQKDKDLRHLRDEVLKKDKLIAQLSEQSANALVRAREEWTTTLARLDAQYREQLEKTAQTHQADIELFTAERVNKLKERCLELEKQLATREHELTREFYERIHDILQKARTREQGVWFETTRLRDSVRYEVEQQFAQRLALVQEEHRTALAALEAKQRLHEEEVQKQTQFLSQDFVQKEERLRLHFQQQLEIREREMKIQIASIEAQTAAKEERLRRERQDALDLAQLSKDHPEQFFRREQEAFRAQTLAEFADKERQLEEHHLQALREAEKRHTDMLAGQQDRWAQEHGHTVAAAQQEILRLRQSVEDQRQQTENIQRQFQQVEATRRQAEERILSLENLMASRQHAAEADLRSALGARDDAHHAELARLRDEMQVMDTRQNDLKHALRQSQHQEAVLRESIRAGVTAQHAEWAKQHADMEQTLRKKELELQNKTEKMDQLLRTAAVEKEAALTDQFQKALEEQRAAFAERLAAMAAESRLRQEQNSQGLVDDWIFGFAHQIRNPLAIIRSTAEVLSDSRASGTEATKSLSNIIQSVDALSERLAQFMDFSKPIPPSTASVALEQVMARALTLVKPRLTQAGVRVQMTADPHLPPVRGRAEQFETAFMALLLNALEAMPKGGALDIQLRQETASNRRIITLRDSGAGLREDHINDIGKPFFTTKAGHIGLGLAHVKRVVAMHGGTFDIQNNPGGGVTVTCAIPGPAAH